MTGSAGIVLRDYMPDDLDAVIEIFQSAVRDIASRDYDAAQVAAWSMVDRAGWALARLAHPAWLALIGEKPAGFADLTGDGLLDMMFVHADFQGHGVASRLLDRVIAEALSRGMPRVETEASLTARPFFEKRGFSVIVKQQVEKRGQHFLNFRMRRML